MRTQPTARSLPGSRRALLARAVGARCLLVLSLVALSAACLGAAAYLDGPTVARWQLADASLLMSCADEPSSSDEPLWCESPDSPHCTRGTPAPEHREPWLGPLVATQAPTLSIPSFATRPLLSAPGDGALLGHAWTDGERLERPPRRA